MHRIFNNGYPINVFAPWCLNCWLSQHDATYRAGMLTGAGTWKLMRDERGAALTRARLDRRERRSRWRLGGKKRRPPARARATAPAEPARRPAARPGRAYPHPAALPLLPAALRASPPTLNVPA